MIGEIHSSQTGHLIPVNVATFRIGCSYDRTNYSYLDFSDNIFLSSDRSHERGEVIRACKEKQKEPQTFLDIWCGEGASLQQGQRAFIKNMVEFFEYRSVLSSSQRKICLGYFKFLSPRGKDLFVFQDKIGEEERQRFNTYAKEFLQSFEDSSSETFSLFEESFDVAGLFDEESNSKAEIIVREASIKTKQTEKYYYKKLFKKKTEGNGMANELFQDFDGYFLHSEQFFRKFLLAACRSTFSPIVCDEDLKVFLKKRFKKTDSVIDDIESKIREMLLADNEKKKRGFLTKNYFPSL